jgi:hypothetical protein
MKNIVEELKYYKQQQPEKYERQQKILASFLEAYKDKNIFDKEIVSQILYILLEDENSNILKDVKELLDDKDLEMAGVTNEIKKNFVRSMIREELEKIDRVKEVYVISATMPRKVQKEDRELDVRAYQVWYNNNIYQLVVWGDQVPIYNLEPENFYDISLTFVNNRLYPANDPFIRKKNKPVDFDTKLQIQKYIEDRYPMITPPLSMIAGNNKTYYAIGRQVRFTPKSSQLEVSFKDGSMETLVLVNTPTTTTNLTLVWGQVINAREANGYAMLVQGYIILKVLEKNIPQQTQTTISNVYGNLIPTQPTQPNNGEKIEKINPTTVEEENDLDDLPL